APQSGSEAPMATHSEYSPTRIPREALEAVWTAGPDPTRRAISEARSDAVAKVLLEATAGVKMLTQAPPSRISMRRRLVRTASPVASRVLRSIGEDSVWPSARANPPD